MKFFALFSAVLAVALASPASWTLNELSEAIQDPHTHPSLLPILEDALNELMYSLVSGSPQTTTTVSTVVQDFSSWTLHELSEAIQDPATDPALLPYLEHGLNTIMATIMTGGSQDYVIVATPVGLIPIDQVIPVPSPVIVPGPVVVPVAPAEVPAASASPLVQIIVNIKSQEEAPADLIQPGPVCAPGARCVSPVIVPNPVDVIAINPSPAVNPVDVIAISAPEVNPVDLISPVPVVVPVGSVDIVGPLL